MLKQTITIMVVIFILFVAWLPCEATGCFSDCNAYKLVCVTGSITNTTGSEAGAVIGITSQKNTNPAITDWTVVFNAAYDLNKWGLQCKNDWANTGCTSSTDSALNQVVYDSKGEDRDVIVSDNGCYSDDEEIDNLTVFATCCKVVKNSYRCGN